MGLSLCSFSSAGLEPTASRVLGSALSMSGMLSPSGNLFKFYFYNFRQCELSRCCRLFALQGSGL